MLTFFGNKVSSCLDFLSLQTCNDQFNDTPGSLIGKICVTIGAWSLVGAVGYLLALKLIFWLHQSYMQTLTHWGRVKHICVGKLTTIGSNNGLSPGRRQVIIWTNAWIFLIGPLGTNFSEILIEIHIFSFKKVHLKMSSRKWWSFSLCLNLLKSLVDNISSGVIPIVGGNWMPRVTRSPLY